MYGHFSYMIIYVYEYLCMFIHIYTYSCVKNFLPGALQIISNFIKFNSNFVYNYKCIRVNVNALLLNNFISKV